MPQETLKEHFGPFVHKMATSDWYTSRVVSAALLPVVMEALEDKNDELSEQFLHLFEQVICDDTPMVRRAAATRLVEVTAARPDRGDVILGMLQEVERGFSWEMSWKGFLFVFGEGFLFFWRDNIPRTSND